MTKKFPNDKVTCISPWYELRINADGSMAYCHAAKISSWEKSDLSFIEWFNKGPLPTKVRENITNGVEVDSCTNCYNAEDKNFISFRQRRNIQGAIFGGEHFKDQVEQSPCYKRMSGTSQTMYPAFFHITLSNLCNLSCRMCFPEFSSQLKSNYNKLELINDNKLLIDWTTDPVKWNNFLQLIENNPQILSLHFMGGEPLFHRKFHEFIDWCIDKQKTDFHLTFVTNATVYNEQLLEKLSKFKSVHIELSVENLHTSNDYIRLGSDFNDIQKNIELFVENKPDNVSIILRTVPQALSIEQYDTLIDFSIKHDISIDNNPLNNPEFLKIVVLPKELKQKITDNLKNKYADILTSTDDTDILDKTVNIRRGAKSLANHINSLISMLEEAEPDNIEELRKKFINYNVTMDKISTVKFKDVYPELLDFYEKYSRI